MAREFCTSEPVCRVTTEGPWKDLHPAITASLAGEFPTIVWTREYDDEDMDIFIKGPLFTDDEEIE